MYVAYDATQARSVELGISGGRRLIAPAPPIIVGAVPGELSGSGSRPACLAGPSTSTPMPSPQDPMPDPIPADPAEQ